MELGTVTSRFTWVRLSGDIQAGGSVGVTPASASDVAQAVSTYTGSTRAFRAVAEVPACPHGLGRGYDLVARHLDVGGIIDQVSDRGRFPVVPGFIV